MPEKPEEEVYFSTSLHGDTVNIVNPKGQIFCSVYMGEGVGDTITLRRAEFITNILNEAKEAGKFG